MMPDGYRNCTGWTLDVNAFECPIKESFKLIPSTAVIVWLGGVFCGGLSAACTAPDAARAKVRIASRIRVTPLM